MKDLRGTNKPFFPTRCFFLTHTTQIKVTLLAFQSSLWRGRLCQHNLITSSLVTRRALFIDRPHLCVFWIQFFPFVRLASYAPQSQIANEELCLCMPLFPLLLSAHIMCPSGDPKNYWGDFLRLCLFPTETVINLHWLSHQAHSTCAPAHLNPTDESTWTGHAAVCLIIVVWFPATHSFKLYCVSISGGIASDSTIAHSTKGKMQKNKSSIRWELSHAHGGLS